MTINEITDILRNEGFSDNSKTLSMIRTEDNILVEITFSEETGIIKITSTPENKEHVSASVTLSSKDTTKEEVRFAISAVVSSSRMGSYKETKKYYEEKICFGSDPSMIRIR